MVLALQSESLAEAVNIGTPSRPPDLDKLSTSSHDLLIHKRRFYKPLTLLLALERIISAEPVDVPSLDHPDIEHLRLVDLFQYSTSSRELLRSSL